MIPKFRGFRIKSDEWVEGSLIYREEPYLHDIVVPIGDNSNVSYAVDRNSIGQYSGLKDKNDVEIYEGDIVHLTSDEGIDYNALIVFKDGGFCAIDGTESNYGFRRYDLSRFDLYLDVIGNIYENPELLEAAE